MKYLNQLTPSPVSIGVPYSKRAILRSRQNDGQLWMESDSGDVVGVALQRLYAGFVLVIPNLDVSVVGTGNQVRLVATGVIGNAVDTLLVTLESEIRRRGTELPYLGRQE